MAAIPDLTEASVSACAPDASSMTAVFGIIKKKAFSNLGVSADKTILMGEFSGSGSKPYTTSVDYIREGKPTYRCSCPSRKLPCKHCLALMLLWAKDKTQFSIREVPEDLAAKRAKLLARDEKVEKGLAGGDQAVAVDAASGDSKLTRKPLTPAEKKKREAQKEGFELLEKLCLDLITNGNWFEESRLEKIERQAPQLADKYLKTLMYTLRRLLVVGRNTTMSDDSKNAIGADLLAQLWATIKMGRAYIDDQVSVEESQLEAEANMEALLGKVWQLKQLQSAGYWKKDVRLLELAYEKLNDQASQQYIERSHLLDLGDGSIYTATTYRPYVAVHSYASLEPQPSYDKILQLRETVIYPGYVNRRIRWQRELEEQVDVKPADLKTAYDHAEADFKTALESYRNQIKNPIAWRDALFLLKCAKVAQVGKSLVLVDGAGTRIEAVQPPWAFEGTLSNLRRAAGMLNGQNPAVYVRLKMMLEKNVIVAEPLAMLTPSTRLRLTVARTTHWFDDEWEA